MNVYRGLELLGFCTKTIPLTLCFLTSSVISLGDISAADGMSFCAPAILLFNLRHWNALTVKSNNNGKVLLNYYATNEHFSSSVGTMTTMPYHTISTLLGSSRHAIIVYLFLIFNAKICCFPVCLRGCVQILDNPTSQHLLIKNWRTSQQLLWSLFILLRRCLALLFICD